MEVKEDRQTTMQEFGIKQVGLKMEAYNILEGMKRQLIKKHKKYFTFSDAIIELKNKRKETNIEFTREEVIQIKNKLKGGNK